MHFAARPGLLRLQGQFRFDANWAQDLSDASLVRCAVVASCLAAAMAETTAGGISVA
jgi:hypothetical protein